MFYSKQELDVMIGLFIRRWNRNLLAIANSKILSIR